MDSEPTPMESHPVVEHCHDYIFGGLSLEKLDEFVSTPHEVDYTVHAEQTDAIK